MSERDTTGKRLDKLTCINDHPGDGLSFEEIDELLAIAHDLHTTGRDYNTFLTDERIRAQENRATIKELRGEVARLRDGIAVILRKAGFTRTADDIRALLANKGEIEA